MAEWDKGVRGWLAEEQISVRDQSVDQDLVDKGDG